MNNEYRDRRVRKERYLSKKLTETKIQQIMNRHGNSSRQRRYDLRSEITSWYETFPVWEKMCNERDVIMKHISNHMPKMNKVTYDLRIWGHVRVRNENGMILDTFTLSRFCVSSIIKESIAMLQLWQVL